MKKFKKFFAALLALALVFGLASCKWLKDDDDDDDNVLATLVATQKTWKFENHSRYNVTVTPKGVTFDSAFTLSPGSSRSVSWYYGQSYNYSYSPSNYVYPEEYSALGEICFWTR